jgi:hypothetical protein
LPAIGYIAYYPEAPYYLTRCVTQWRIVRFKKAFLARLRHNEGTVITNQCLARERLLEEVIFTGLF